MHSFRKTEFNTYEIFFDSGSATLLVLFETPSLPDACRAVSVLNGGSATFAVIEKRQGDRISLSHSIAVPGK